jgi:hypothetical protein
MLLALTTRLRGNSVKFWRQVRNVTPLCRESTAIIPWFRANFIQNPTQSQGFMWLTPDKPQAAGQP